MGRYLRAALVSRCLPQAGYLGTSAFQPTIPILKDPRTLKVGVQYTLMI